MNKEKKFRLPAAGGSSLLVIFSVLCLVTFALLGMSTVQADYRLAEASQNAVTGYYQADYQAEEIFARLRGGELPDGVIVSGDLYFYACPVSEKQELQVELQKQGDAWTVLQWQTRSLAEYGDELIEVWDGEPMF